MNTSYKLVRLMLMAALLAGTLNLSLVPVMPVRAAGTISLTDFNTYSQNFDTLANSGTENTLMPNGWDFNENGISIGVTYSAGTGSSATGDTYSFGASGSTERAFGGLQTNTFTPTTGASFTNNTGGAIDSLNISYTGEQWRLGATGRPDRMDFQYSLDATSLSTGTWVDVDTLDFSAPVTTGTVGSLVGNNAGNRTAISASIGGLNILDGAAFWIRWQNFNATGSDDGLAVDDFSLTPTLRLPKLSINDVTRSEGDSGTQTFTYVVSLDAPALASGVTFDIATADGSATAADNDYIANSQPGIIPGGETSCTFDVTVNGDKTPESDESFLVNVTNITGADAVDYQAMGTIINDDFIITSTYTIQGSGSGTSLAGELNTIGVVIADFEGASPALGGFYIQDQTGDNDSATSDGLFVYNGSNTSVALGDLVRVTGVVSEYQGQTQISATKVTVLSSGNIILPTDITLPFTSMAKKEQYEGMLVRFPQVLYVTDTSLLGRFSQITLSSAGRLCQPTNIVLPGAPALAMQASNDLNQVIVDDALNSEYPDPILFGRGGSPLSASNTLRGGDTLTGLTGVFTYTWGGGASSPNAYRIRPNSVPSFAVANARPSTPPVVGGSLKAASMNLSNYFNTFTGCVAGVNGTSTDCRGANNQVEFDRQSAKTVNTILAMNADVIGILEIENDGYGPTSAIQDLVTRLNALAGAGTYAFINPDTANGTNSLGTDAVRIGILYKPAKVTPLGTTAVLHSANFINGGDSVARNQPSLLQAFQQNTSGEVFLLDVVYLKSRDSACDFPGSNDGQAECNFVRLNAVNALREWFTTNPTGTGDPDILIVGDLNSYAMEDPIAAFESSGYSNLVGHFNSGAVYTYALNGQWGSLDYALASPSLLSQQVIGAGNWTVNSDEPSALDYNTENKSTGQITSLYNADPFRSSEHDPILVGLSLDSNGPPSVVSITRANADPTHAASVTFTVTFSEFVKGVGLADFHLYTTGVTNANVSGVSGSDKVYTVTVYTGSDNGTIRLDVPLTATITDLVGNAMTGLPFTNGQVYEVNKTPVFADVPFSYWANSQIERLYRDGLTGGCGNGNYCPSAVVTRDQMAVFLLRAKYGKAYAPDPVGSSTGFSDVSISHWAAAWIKQLAKEEITGGCGNGKFCPSQPVTRDQMAVFLLRAKYGGDYNPPAVGSTTGFSDVPVNYWAAAWIKQLAAEGITGGCGNEKFCPSASVTRAQMAVFLVTGFNLP